MQKFSYTNDLTVGKLKKDNYENTQFTSENIKNIKYAQNLDFSNTINNYFNNFKPNYFITLTFRTDRKDNSNTHNNRIDGKWIPKYFEQDSISNFKLTTAIKQFFNNGFVIGEKVLNQKSINNQNKKIIAQGYRDVLRPGGTQVLINTEKGTQNLKAYKASRPITKLIYSPSLKELTTRYFFVIEKGSRNGRIHIHALVHIPSYSKTLFKAILDLWQEKHGFYDIQDATEEHASYISKQQYILKDYLTNSYENNLTSYFGFRSPDDLTSQDQLQLKLDFDKLIQNS